MCLNVTWVGTHFIRELMGKVALSEAATWATLTQRRNHSWRATPLSEGTRALSSNACFHARQCLHMREFLFYSFLMCIGTGCFSFSVFLMPTHASLNFAILSQTKSRRATKDITGKKKVFHLRWACLEGCMVPQFWYAVSPKVHVLESWPPV